MTEAECEIVANAGIQLREIARALTIAATSVIRELDPAALVVKMDNAAMQCSEVYGALSALPLEAEGEE